MQLNVHSTNLIYSPGVFAWIVETVMPFDTPKAQELLLALGIPQQYVEPILAGQYDTRTEAETLIITTR